MIFNLYKTIIKKNQFVYLRNQNKIMTLAIDIGNTKIKVAVFEQDTIIEKDIVEHKELKKSLDKFIEKHTSLSLSVLSSVSNCPNEALELLKSKTKLLILSQESKFPFINHYETPLTLGIDRKVLVSGATIKFPNQNCLIIDAGSCITYDFIDEKSNYFGGAISPGVEMRYKALNTFTSKLPLLEKEYPSKLIGNSTNQSIHSGIINSIAFEIQGFIDTYSIKYKDLTIILTGGDAEFLAKRLKNTIFANSNFLLESLNLLNQYNIK